MQYRTLDQAALRGKRVLLRAGFDVPVEEGNIVDTERIEAILPTMRFILDAGAALVIMAHQGRPKGDGFEAEFSQKPLVPVLEKLLDAPVAFAPSCAGPETLALALSLEPGHVLLLENLRFHAGEKKNDPSFSKELAELGDLYVNDAFPNMHRDDASMVGVPKLLPAFMGLRLAEEVRHLSSVLEDPRRPLTVIVGGAKMETKIPVVASLLTSADDILLGGTIANTFIAARGFAVGRSKYEPAFVPRAQEFMLEGEKEELADIHVPRDAVVASEPKEGAATLDIPLEDIEGDMAMYDIGSVTAERYAARVAASGMVVWNGPVGLYEIPTFSRGTLRLAEAIAHATRERGVVSIVGGGDTLDAHRRYGLSLAAYSFVSTGGGAMLEFLSGKKFHALEALSL
ncbi:phosphoglycerate kinase [Candidatus Peregrinibacteria bacterium]|nr:phosphoglycerate kinase [Candidatus Peregrinibacteria bacterium]